MSYYDNPDTLLHAQIASQKSVLTDQMYTYKNTITTIAKTPIDALDPNIFNKAQDIVNLIHYQKVVIQQLELQLNTNQILPVDEPVETQPVVEPVETQPVVEPVETQPVVEPVETQPVVEPVETQPVVEPVETQTVVEPVVEEVVEPVVKEVVEPVVDVSSNPVDVSGNST